MSNTPVPNGLQEDDWQRLLDAITEGSVVPVLGQELLQVNVDGQNVSLYTYVAHQLMKRLGVTIDGEGATVSNVVCAYLETHQNKNIAYHAIYDILRSMKCGPPAPLLQLAEIRGFSLFLTTTFDSLMADALNQVRFGGASNTLQLSFKKSATSEDIPEHMDGRVPIVYHIFGKAMSLPTYAATEDDLLEFGCRWQERDSRPRQLASSLRDRFLIVLGCSFQNWLSRFFLRAMKGDLLFPCCDGVLADERTRHDEELSLFLSRCQGLVYGAGGATEFIQELSERWKARHPAGTAAQETEELTQAEVQDSLVESTIFLSYAKEDREIALVVKQQLEEAGLDTWMDVHGLEPGDRWEKIIYGKIDHSSIFIPLISHNVEKGARRYCRSEWSRAIKESANRRGGDPFILPVVLDDATWSKDFPAEFRPFQWVQLHEGALPRDFILKCTETVRQLRRKGEVF